VFGKNGMQGSLQVCLEIQIWFWSNDQIEGIIRDKLNLMRNVLVTDENIRIQRAWKVNNVES
jgi:hypothetical protein